MMIISYSCDLARNVAAENSTRRCVPTLRKGSAPHSSRPNRKWRDNVEKIGGLLRSQLSVHRHDADRVALRYLRQDVDQQP